MAEDISILESAGMAARLKALERLSKSGDPRARRAIVDVMEDRNRVVRREATRIVALAPTPEDMWPLAHRLRDTDPRTRAWAVEGLLRLGTPSAIMKAMAVMEDPEPMVRQRLHTLLGKGWSMSDLLAVWSAKKAWSYMEMLGSRESGSFAAGIKGLGLMGFPEDLAFVYWAFFTDDTFARRNAADALCQRGDPASLEWIRPFGDRTMSCWVRAARSLPAHVEVDPEAMPQTAEALLERRDAPCTMLEHASTPDQARNFAPRCPLPGKLSHQRKGAILAAWGMFEKAREEYSLARPSPSSLLQWDPFEVWGLFASMPKRASELGFKVWDAFLYWNSKWIPEQTWAKLDEVRPKGLPKEKKTPLQRLLESLAKERMPGTPTELMPSPLPAGALLPTINGAGARAEGQGLLLTMISTPPGPLVPSILEALARTGCPKEGRKIVEKYLASRDTDVRAAALRLAGSCGMWNELVRAAGTDDRKIAYTAIEVLERHGRGGRELLKLFESRPFGRCALALARMGVSGAARAISEALKRPTPVALYGDRALMVRALAMVKGDTSRELLHPSAEVRLEALAGRIPEGSLSAHACCDPDFRVRTEARRRMSNKRPRP